MLHKNVFKKSTLFHRGPLAHNTLLFAGCQMGQSSPSMPPPPSPSPLLFAISLSLFSPYLSFFPDCDRSRWWSVRLASRRWRDNFKTDRERAALSASGADDPGNKRGSRVGRKRAIIMTDCERLGFAGELGGCCGLRHSKPLQIHSKSKCESFELAGNMTIKMNAG